jgi:hypothetical protein
VEPEVSVKTRQSAIADQSVINLPYCKTTTDAGYIDKGVLASPRNSWVIGSQLHVAPSQGFSASSKE